MFTRAFSRMLAAGAAGSPAVLARPVIWSAGLIGEHAVAANTVFGCVQLLIGLGIAWRRSARIALGASVLWAAAVWWLGEGCGGLLSGRASPVAGAPGPVLLYAVAAVLLWPATRDRPAPFVAGRAVGATAARVVWLVLWASLAWFAVQPAGRAPRGLASTVAATAAGQPGWLAAAGRQLAALLAGQGLATAIALAAALLVVAAGPYLPPPWARATLVLAVLAAAFIWLAQGLGGIFTGSATDPDSGPLLALLALAYWPTAGPGRSRTAKRIVA
jgi:hypothetical protein